MIRLSGQFSDLPTANNEKDKCEYPEKCVYSKVVAQIRVRRSSVCRSPPFNLDGKGPLGLRKLKQSTFRLVQEFDIMRTVFVPYGDRFLQVILRKLQPEFVVHETELDLDELTTQLQQRDCKNGPRLGETLYSLL